MNFTSMFMFPNVFRLLNSVHSFVFFPPSLLSVDSSIHCQAAWVTATTHQIEFITPPPDNTHTHTWLLFSGTVCTTQWREFIQNVTFCMSIVSLKILWVIFQRKLNPLNLDFPPQILPVFMVLRVRFFQTSSSFIPFDNEFSSVTS